MALVYKLTYHCSFSYSTGKESLFITLLSHMTLVYNPIYHSMSHITLIYKPTYHSSVSYGIGISAFFYHFSVSIGIEI